MQNKVLNKFKKIVPQELTLRETKLRDLKGIKLRKDPARREGFSKKNQQAKT